MKLSELVEKYIALRDKKAKMKAEYEAQVKNVEQVMDKIEAKLLEVFDSTGLESAKCETGTAYVSVRTSASVADKDAFMNYVKDNGEWSLLEVRASKTAVDQFKAANDDQLPPGVSWSAERVVNFRRS